MGAAIKGCSTVINTFVPSNASSKVFTPVAPSCWHGLNEQLF